MLGQTRRSRLSELFEDEAMRAEFEEVWTEREKARTAVRGTLTGGSSFRAMRKAWRNFREAMQAAEGRRGQEPGGVRR